MYWLIIYFLKNERRAEIYAIKFHLWRNYDEGLVVQTNDGKEFLVTLWMNQNDDYWKKFLAQLTEIPEWQFRESMCSISLFLNLVVSHETSMGWMLKHLWLFLIPYKALYSWSCLSNSHSTILMGLQNVLHEYQLLRRSEFGWSSHQNIVHILLHCNVELIFNSLLWRRANQINN